MKKYLSPLKFFIGWPLSFIALFFVARLLIGKQAAFAQLHTVNGTLIVLSAMCFLAFFFLRALFWQKLLQAKHMHFSYRQTAYTWGFSEFARYIPGGIWPILSRNAAYTKLGTEQKAILASILQEAEFLVIACLLLSLFCINFLIFAILPGMSAIIVPALFVASAVFATVLFIFHDKLFEKKPAILTHFFPAIPATTIAYLLTVMTCAFFLFGLAQYFAVYALTPLYVPHILSLTGFFVFSFLAGYLSFLAPMGLGVREGIVTVGLAKYMPLPVAALGAIASRVMQIASELLFLGIVFLWFRFHRSWMQKIETHVLRWKYGIGVTCAGICYTWYFTLASFLRYDNFFTGRFDLGNMDQTVWNTIHGRLFQVTDPNGIGIVSRLASHADFLLILLSPFYLIWQDPRTLLFIQSIALGIGGIFVYLIAKHILSNKPLALIFALSYYIYPAINHANLYDFHAVTLAVPLFLASFYLLFKKKYVGMTLLLFLAGLTKEEVWIITGLLGLYLIFVKKQYVVGAIISVISFSIFYYLFWHAIPQAAVNGQHFALSYFSEFGSTPGNVIKNIVLSPATTLHILLEGKQIIYLTELFAPLAFTALAAPLFLIFILPEMGIDLLSKNAQLHTINFHYASIFTPFIFLASIYGVRFLIKKFPLVQQVAGYYIVVAALICAYVYGPLPGAYFMNHDMFTNQLSYAPLVDSFLASIPKKYSIAASNNVGSHVSHRKKIFTIPVGLKDADIVVFLLTDQFAQPSLAAQKKMAESLAADPTYVQLIAYKDFVVFKKKDVPTYFRKKSQSILPLFKGN